MVELFGINLGTPLQGGILATLLLILGVVVRTWIVGMPERGRVENEGRTIASAEAVERYKAWRLEIHELKNEIAKVSAKQVITDGELSQAIAINRQNRSQMVTMLFLIRLLISELKSIDPQSAIVRQAELTLDEMEHHTPDDPSKSDALNTAETAVRDAKQTVRSAKATCEEVKKEEGEK